MAHEFKYLRNKLTGLSGEYPADFLDLFPDFEEVDPNEAYCVDCVVTLDGDDEEETVSPKSAIDRYFEDKADDSLDFDDEQDK